MPSFRIASVWLFLSLAIAVSFSGASIVHSQKSFSTPESQEFVSTDDLLAPWRSSRCALLGKEILNQLCVDYVGDDYLRMSKLDLFNADGSIWRTLELNIESPDYFGNSKIPEFLPFAKNFTGQTIVLRLVGVSEDWYKVEINENTQATRYARRADKAWSRTNWEGWLYKSVTLALADDHEPLRDAPGGKIIPAARTIRFKRVKFLRAEGEWAYIQGIASSNEPKPELYSGWLRWRDGRKILVGCYFNDQKAPAPSL